MVSYGGCGSAGFVHIAIGLGLTLIHLISIPITNTSVNPARSTGVALWAGKELFAQVWLFWLAPIAGAIAAGFTYHYLFAEPPVTEQDQIEALTNRDFDRSQLEQDKAVR